MLYFETTGTVRDRGRQHGEACREVFQNWAGRVMDELAQELGVVGPAEVLTRVTDTVGRWVLEHEAANPEAVAECRAIAEGLSVAEDLYFAVTSAYRLLGTFGNCTTVGFRTDEGRVILGKTDDIAEHELGMNVLERARPEHGYEHLKIQFAGTIWPFSGLNERGLAVALTGIPGPPSDGPGVPSLAVMYGILETCATVDEALRRLDTVFPNHYGISLLVADASDTMALVEKTGAGCVALPPRADGTYVHTNHILDADFASQNLEQKEPYLSNGRRRHGTAAKRLESDPRTWAGMRNILSDRSAGRAIWQEGEDGLWTDYAIMLQPSSTACTVWTQRPNRSDGSAYTLDRGPTQGDQS